MFESSSYSVITNSTKVSFYEAASSQLQIINTDIEV